MDCATVTVYPWDAILAQAFLGSNGSVFLIDDTTACVKGRPYLVEPNPSEGRSMPWHGRADRCRKPFCCSPN